MDTSDAADLYLRLLARTLTRYTFGGDLVAFEPEQDAPVRPVWDVLRDEVGPDVRLARFRPFDPSKREVGRDWPADAETMVGLKRLENLRDLIEAAIQDEVSGDLIETGIWRGGTAIFMRGVLAAHGVEDRIVWAADSFEGLPRPDPDRFPADAGDEHWKKAELAVSIDEVKRNFERYGLLDRQVRFLEGWFEETLPDASIEDLALMRLDGDMYGSTMVALESLYPKLNSGGFVVIDDYGAIEQCRRAVEDFRVKNAIDEPLIEIDWTGVYWRRGG